MSRKNAREIVYQLLFPINFSIEKDSKISFEMTLENLCEGVVLDDEDKKFIEKEYNGIIKNKETLLEIIKNNLTNYSIEKIYKPDLIALLIAVYEITFEDEISPKTSVDEVVNICKKYSTENSYKFVNGVLANILKDNNNG